MPASDVGAALAALKAASGMTWAELAAVTGASSGDYVRKVAAGVKPGRNLAGAVEQLQTTGRVSRPPPRRVAASGQLARVRASETRTGSKSREVLPGARTAPRRGSYGVSRTLTHGGRGQVVTISAPKTEGVGRERARAEMVAAVRSAGRNGGRVSFVVTVTDGQKTWTVPVGARGGYDASQAARRFRLGVDPFDWLGDQDLARYGASVTNLTVVGVAVNVTPG